MSKFLVGIQYHDPESLRLWKLGVVEDYESSLGLFVEADSPAEAIEWGKLVAEALHRKTNPRESSDWASHHHACWIEENPDDCPWSHCLSLFQHVKVGEWPNLEKMNTETYIKWVEENRLAIAESSKSTAVENKELLKKPWWWFWT